MGKPTTNHQQRNRTAFGFATQRQAIDYANEALDLARKDVLDLQGKTLTAFNLMSAGRGDFGTDMLRTIDAHARTREFGALLWQDALIGQAVTEVAQRVARQEIEAREARRPHRRLIAWAKGILSPRRVEQVAPCAELQDFSLAHFSTAGSEALRPGDLGEGTDEDLAAIRAAIDAKPMVIVAGDVVPDQEKPSESETPEPETVTYPEPEEHIGHDVPGAMDDGIAGADEYRENAKRESEEKPQP